jgi:hypothetical protein
LLFNSSSDGIDVITDLVLGSNTYVGDHIEISASGFGDGLVPGGTAPLLTFDDIAIATNPGTDGYFIFDNSGANAGTLYWDATGGSGSDGTAIALLSSVTALTPLDLRLI